MKIRKIISIVSVAFLAILIAGCPKPPPIPTIPTPTTSGWPSGEGFRGDWETAPATFTTYTEEDFVLESYWQSQAGADHQKAANRPIIVRLLGNPLVLITDVSNEKKVIGKDSRSAYVLTDADGKITVTLKALEGSSRANPVDGVLWAIDEAVMTGEEAHGIKTTFTVVSPRR